MPQLTRSAAFFMSYGLVSALAVIGMLWFGGFNSPHAALGWSSPEYWLAYGLLEDFRGYEFIFLPIVCTAGILGIGVKLLFAWLISPLFVTDEVDTSQVDPLPTATP